MSLEEEDSTSGDPAESKSSALQAAGEKDILSILINIYSLPRKIINQSSNFLDFLSLFVKEIEDSWIYLEHLRHIFISNVNFGSQESSRERRHSTLPLIVSVSWPPIERDPTLFALITYLPPSALPLNPYRTALAVSPDPTLEAHRRQVSHSQTLITPIIYQIALLRYQGRSRNGSTKQYGSTQAC